MNMLGVNTAITFFISGEVSRDMSCSISASTNRSASSAASSAATSSERLGLGPPASQATTIFKNSRIG